jgi:hypothetical protein
MTIMMMDWFLTSMTTGGRAGQEGSQRSLFHLAKAKALQINTALLVWVRKTSLGYYFL